MKSSTMISLCKVQLGLKQNTFTQLTISDHSLDFVVTAKCDLISKFATWLNFEFSIFSDLKYIKYSSRNWFIISNQSSFTFIICSFFGFWVVQNGSEVQKSPGQAGIDSVLKPTGGFRIQNPPMGFHWNQPVPFQNPPLGFENPPMVFKKHPWVIKNVKFICQFFCGNFL